MKLTEIFKNDREFSDDIIKQKNMVVVQHNDLISKAKYDLSTNELKIMDYIISKIKPDDTNFEIITTSLYEITEMLNLRRSGRTYNQLTRNLRNLRQKEVIIYDIERETLIVTGWLKEFEVSKTGQVIVEISTKLAPYLLELKNKGNYTQHILKDTIQLDSKYSIRLYKLMRECDKTYGQIMPSIVETPEDLKEKLSAPKSYNWSQLKQNVVDRAIDEINLKIEDMNLSLKTIKKGRRIVKIKIQNNYYPVKINTDLDMEPVPMIDWLNN